MNKLLLAVAAATASLASAPAFAIDPPAAAAPAVKLSTADSTIGDLLDNPAAKAVLTKHLPALVGNAQIEMARSMTLFPWALFSITPEPARRKPRLLAGSTTPR